MSNKEHNSFIMAYDRALIFHRIGRHEIALNTIARYSGNWHIADNLGLRLGHRSVLMKLKDNIFRENPLYRLVGDSCGH